MDFVKNNFDYLRQPSSAAASIRIQKKFIHDLARFGTVKRLTHFSLQDYLKELDFGSNTLKLNQIKTEIKVGFNLSKKKKIEPNIIVVPKDVFIYQKHHNRLFNITKYILEDDKYEFVINQTDAYQDISLEYELLLLLLLLIITSVE